jgi:sugar phosphate isomerase/epimerase
MRATSFLGFAAGAALWLAMATVAVAADGTAKPGIANPLFAFDNGTGYGRVSADEQAAMLKDLGYAGIAFTGTQRIPAMLRALDARGLKMLSIYVELCLAPEKGKPAYDPGLKAAIAQLKGRDTQIWIPISGGKPSATNLDDRAVALIREIADMAEKSGLRVVLYPHTWMYVERSEDAVRLAKKVNRKNVGVGFNLCHFLRVDNEKNLDRRLQEMRPYLLAVNINGADGGSTNGLDWDRLIQTLDRGSFDVGRVLKRLKQLGYTGPVGLQCYAIPGDCRTNLARSMKAWQKLSARTAAGQ